MEGAVISYQLSVVGKAVLIPFLNNDIALAVFMEGAVMWNKLGSLFYIKKHLLTEMV